MINSSWYHHHTLVTSEKRISHYWLMWSVLHDDLHDRLLLIIISGPTKRCGFLFTWSIHHDIIITIWSARSSVYILDNHRIIGQHYHQSIALELHICHGWIIQKIMNRTKIFWSIELNDLWSKKVYRPKIIVWSGAIFILIWSCYARHWND